MSREISIGAMISILFNAMLLSACKNRNQRLLVSILNYFEHKLNFHVPKYFNQIFGTVQDVNRYHVHGVW
jgi:hypothetical protein